MRALEMGIERMAGFLRRFGLGFSTGIDIPGEKSGIVPDPAWKKAAFSRREDQVWFPGETVIAGIGQGYMLTTPLQLARAYAVIASDGVRRPVSLLRTEQVTEGERVMSRRTARSIPFCTPE